MCMVNQSKANDQRFWEIWRRAGAVGSLDSVKQECPLLMKYSNKCMVLIRLQENLKK